MGTPCLWLDGDRIRQGLSQELGFSPSDRMENHRRIIEAANIAEEQGIQVVVSAIAPQQSIRSKINELTKIPVAWIYLDTDETTCRHRDTKGLYAATQGGNFSQLFEPPTPGSVLIQINTSAEDISSSKTKWCNNYPDGKIGVTSWCRYISDQQVSSRLKPINARLGAFQ
jgi:adenylylsulfate kinase-like enzyme